MKSEDIVILIVVINTMIALAVLIFDIVRKKGGLTFVHFFILLFCPVVGIIVFLGAYVFDRILDKQLALSYEDISFDATRSVKKIKANLKEEIDIVPLQEAFLVSNHKDRRKALLATLKKDYKRNIATVIRGINNDDSETSHYAASVVLSTNTDYLNRLSRLRAEFDRALDDPKPAHDYIEGLTEYMKSDILDNVDKIKYAHFYLEALDFLCDGFADEVPEEYFTFGIQTLIEINDFDLALSWSQRAVRYYPENDRILYAIMKIYYKNGSTERFISMIKEIMESTISISNETLQVIRFFLYK